MRRILPFLALLTACGGGSSVTTNRPTTPDPETGSTTQSSSSSASGHRCEVDVQGNDVTIVRDPQNGYGFSLPPPDAWSIECIEEENRIARGENTEIDAAVTVTRDDSSRQTNETSYLRDYTREVRAQLIARGASVTNLQLEVYEGAKLGLLEVRLRDGGVTSLFIVATSVLRADDGTYLRFRVTLPSEGSFGHGDADPMVQRALLTAYSFGSL